jgi:hypothetical protein
VSDPSNLPDLPATSINPTSKALVKRAMTGDRTALPALRRLLDSPTIAEYLGDLARRVRHDLLHRLTNTDLALREAAPRELDRLRAAVAGPNPSPLEQLLVERVAVAWVQANEADWTLCRAAVSPDAEFLQKRADHAQRRFLAAVRALAAVRKLALPTVQVNIAEQQVNLAGG